MVDKKNEVSKIEDDVPAYLKDHNVVNDDNFDASDIVIPRVKLLQGLSQEVEDFDHANIGHFWHTGMDLDLGQEVEFVVVARRKKFLLTTPMTDKQGILARCDDGKTWDRTGSWEVQIDKKTVVTWEIADPDLVKSGLGRWGTFDPEDENSPPAATMFYDYAVLLPAYPELGPAVISLARSQIKPARKGLNDKIKLHESNGRPMQALVFKAKATTQQNEDGQDFKNWQFMSGGFNKDEDLFKQAVELKNILNERKIEDEDGAASETDTRGEDVTNHKGF